MVGRGNCAGFSLRVHVVEDPQSSGRVVAASVDEATVIRDTIGGMLPMVRVFFELGRNRPGIVSRTSQEIALEHHLPLNGPRPLRRMCLLRHPHPPFGLAFLIPQTGPNERNWRSCAETLATGSVSVPRLAHVIEARLDFVDLSLTTIAIRKGNFAAKLRKSLVASDVELYPVDRLSTSLP